MKATKQRDFSQLPEKLKASISINEHGCWIWDARKENGYGRVYFNSQEWLTHRLTYSLLKAPLTEGLVMDHYLMNPGPRNAPCSKACCNPLHLEEVTNAENIRRGRKRWTKLNRYREEHRARLESICEQYDTDFDGITTDEIEEDKATIAKMFITI